MELTTGFTTPRWTRWTQRIVFLGVLGVLGGDVNAQTNQPPRLGIGRPATPAEIAALDIDIMPDGHGLPAGRGTPAEGETIYAARCAACHGKTGREGPN